MKVRAYSVLALSHSNNFEFLGARTSGYLVLDLC